MVVAQALHCGNPTIAFDNDVLGAIRLPGSYDHLVHSQEPVVLNRPLQLGQALVLNPLHRAGLNTRLSEPMFGHGSEPRSVLKPVVVRVEKQIVQGDF
jgi:hypothetical protein